MCARLIFCAFDNRTHTFSTLRFITIVINLRCSCFRATCCTYNFRAPIRVQLSLIIASDCRCSQRVAQEACTSRARKYDACLIVRRDDEDAENYSVSKKKKFTTTLLLLLLWDWFVAMNTSLNETRAFSPDRAAILEYKPISAGLDRKPNSLSWVNSRSFRVRSTLGLMEIFRTAVTQLWHSRVSKQLRRTYDILRSASLKVKNRTVAYPWL